MNKKLGSALLVLAMAGSVLAGCGQQPAQSQQGGQSGNQPAQTEAPKTDAPKLSGSIKIDGSSTVFPISEAVAEEFQKAQPDVQVTVGQSGTGGGFKKFVVGEIDISDASRPIKDKEKEDAAKNKIDFVELPVAYDGISIVVNKENAFVDKLTVDELKKIWEPESKVKTWKDVRADWPAEEIKLYGPGTDSGTFEYFTEAVVGKAKASRSDYTASEDDNVLVQGIAGDKNALGYFGFSYFEENQDKLKLIPVEADGKAVSPSTETIKDGSYKPLSRPLFIYVSKASLQKPEVKEFVKFYIEQAPELVKSVFYVPLTDDKYKEALAQIQ
ncbi:phosphate ABC transporter substrate-binding protein PstS family protein [Brevibacillus sp. SYSU BS000544]|uniref:PstS family phosphate ABC transporter substrate-binding protein n=1 Tax=Brevibacillus sp. SYSU BS000544 TaxID=3416443 RepID=UPI003CE5A064